MAELAKIATMIPKAIKSITKFGKDITKFIKKSVMLAPVVILTFVFIFFGSQILIGFITGTPGLIPHIPLLFFTIFCIYSLVINYNKDLKKAQIALFKGFISFLTNPVIKSLIGFNVKVDPKKPEKSMGSILKWIGKNILKLILFILIILIIIRLLVQKIINILTR